MIHVFCRGVPDILSSLYSPEISELQYVAGQVANSMNEPRFTDSKVRHLLFVCIVISGFIC